MQYPDYRRNYAIAPGRERALDEFLHQEHNGAAHPRETVGLGVSMRGKNHD